MARKDEVRERFIECFNLCNISQGELALQLGNYNEGNLSGILKRAPSRYLRDDKIELFCKICGINPDYIFKGIGPRMKSEIFKNENNEKPNVEKQLEALKKELEEVKLEKEKIAGKSETFEKLYYELQEKLLTSKDSDSHVPKLKKGGQV